MLQIKTEISSLTVPQREALSAFILAFPSNTEAVSPFTEDDEEVIIPAFSVHTEDDDEGEPTPEAAFSAGPVLVTPAAPVPVTSPGLDKAGLPWDERIHASSKALTAEGYWRKKRGVEDATVATVEAELKALMGLPAAVPAPVTVNPTIAVAEATTAPATAEVPPPPPPAPAPAAGDRQAFVELIGKASLAIGAKRLTQDELTAAVVSVGVPSLPLLGNRLDLVPQVAAAIDLLLASRP